MFCENCGEKIQMGDRICSRCGSPVYPYDGTSPQNPVRRDGGQQKKTEEKKSSSNVFLVLGIVGGVILVAAIAVILFFIIGGSNRMKRNERGPMNNIASEVGDEATNSPQVTETIVPKETPAETPAMTPAETPAITPAETPAITPIPTPQASVVNGSEQMYTTMYVVNCNESITLRTSPSTSASEICQIPLGAAVSYVETAGNGFYKIIYNGKTGYSLASYLDTYYHESAQTYQTDTTMYVVNCNESITLRTSPSTSASEICQIPLGATVEFVDFAGNGFYKVAYNGYVGYALASYLS